MNMPEGWIIARETAVTDLENKELGYTIIPGAIIFPSEDEALEAIGELCLPLGWVIVPLVSVLSAAPTPPAQESFQDRVQPWMMACFGPEISSDTIERNHRFLEESLELVQACGCTQSEAHQLVDYVYGDHIGEPKQEAGGVMVTLAALCLAHGIDMHEAGETELSRIWTMVEKIRTKQAAKPKHSPLPASLPFPKADAVDAAKYRALNTPEIRDFIVAVEREALHQRERWGSEHDAGKFDSDWFWLIGYLAGKAIRPDTAPEKQLHHIITTAAALLNWHAAKMGAHTSMRPGIAGDQS